VVSEPDPHPADPAYPDEQGRNDGERWFERYLRTHGYAYEYEPPDLGVSRRPDFLVRRDGVEIVLNYDPPICPGRPSGADLLGNP
jgi:hypothetical protein